jgi:hypothetical protein
MRACAAICAGLAALIVAQAPVIAWEAETTHAGLAERAALASGIWGKGCERTDP